MTDPITKPLRMLHEIQATRKLQVHLEGLFPEIADALDAAEDLPLGPGMQYMRFLRAMNALRAAIAREVGHG